MFNEIGTEYEFNRIMEEEKELFDLIAEGYNTRQAKRLIAKRKRKRDKQWAKQAAKEAMKR